MAESAHNIDEGFRARAFECALDVSALGIVVADSAGHIVSRNDVAAQWLDGERAVLLPDDLEELVATTLDGRQVARTLDILGPPRRFISVVSKPFYDRSGQVDGAVVAFEDATERRYFEAGRRDFIANVSHELKTPVGALGLLAETLMVEREPATVERLINRLHVEAMRVGTVIDDLLSLSRIESGPIAFETMVARLLVDQAVNRVTVTAEMKQTPIDVKGDNSATVYANHRDVVSALQHLLENALKYSSDGSNVEVSIVAKGDWTEISVTDHGIGIEQRYVERIFERFYRVDDARTRTTGGTGLGLSIVRHVVHAHGGDVRVSSQKGVGSTFTVRFPASPSAGTRQMVVEGGTDG